MFSTLNDYVFYHVKQKISLIQKTFKLKNTEYKTENKSENLKISSFPYRDPCFEIWNHNKERFSVGQ